LTKSRRLWGAPRRRLANSRAVRIGEFLELLQFQMATDSLDQ
jgi:hypothetical protein